MSYKTIIDMAECAINGVRHRLKEGEIPLQVKFDGNILEVWYQDKLNREKDRLNEPLGESSILTKVSNVGWNAVV